MAQTKLATFFQTKPTPAIEQASATEKVPQAPPPVDAEQDFLDFFLSKATGPLVRGVPLKSQRVVTFGQSHGHSNCATHGIADLPKSFRKWCARNRCGGFNSVQVRIYDAKPPTSTAWRTESVGRLAKGDMIILSFAARARDRNKTLATHQFRWPDKRAADEKKKIAQFPLRHSTVVRFNATLHKAKRCEHRAAKVACPRIEIALRCVTKRVCA